MTTELTHKQLHHPSTQAILHGTPPILLHCFDAPLFSSLVDDERIPNSHKEAMSLPKAAQWKEAEERKMTQLGHRLKVAHLVTLPLGARLLPSKWSYKIKWNDTYKARFVVRGDKQQPGVDFEDMFAAVVRPETFRVIMALIAALDLEADN